MNRRSMALTSALSFARHAAFASAIDEHDAAASGARDPNRAPQFLLGRQP
jgi:hypothetical protein